MKSRRFRSAHVLPMYVDYVLTVAHDTRFHASQSKKPNKKKQTKKMSEGSEKRVYEDESSRSELEVAYDLVKRHRRETAQARARVIELEAQLERAQEQLLEAKAAVGHVTMLLLRCNK